MKLLPFLLLSTYLTFVSGHGGCISNENCTMPMNHTMSANESMDEKNVVHFCHILRRELIFRRAKYVCQPTI